MTELNGIGIISSNIQLPDFKNIQQLTLFYNDYGVASVKGQKIQIAITKNDITLAKNSYKLSYKRIKALSTLLDQWNK